MGTGKTSIGIRLAQILDRKFVDTDAEIVKILGMPVKEIFRKLGEVRFRSEERLLIQKLSAGKNQVISTGGGSVLDPDNLAIFRANSDIVCLTAAPDEIIARVNRKKGTRPLLGKRVDVDTIQAMLEARKPFYDQADYRIATDQRDFQLICQEIVALLCAAPQ
jgi:shikimate kinase